MKIKRVVALTLVACMAFGMQVNAGMKTHWLKSSGSYHVVQMNGKQELKYSDAWNKMSKKQKKEVIRLYNKDPRKFYKKYRKKFDLSSVFKTKLKNNTFTIWGSLKYKGNGITKKYKFGKYKFKLSKNARITYGRQGDNEPIFETASVKKTRKYLKKPCGLSYTFEVTNGKITSISSNS